MTVVVYRSDDASAPTLNGVAGSVINVLDAILVNGYGSKAAAGWAKEFSGTDLAVYRPATGNRFRLRVDDTATASARIRGYESMTAVSTGTGAFPSTAQISLDSALPLIPKGSGATARSWVVIASSKAFYFFAAPSATDALFTGYFGSDMRTVFFGDFISYKQGDQFATGVLGSVTASSNNEVFGTVMSTSMSPMTGHYMARPHTQFGGSIGFFKGLPLPYYWNSSTGLGVTMHVPVPEPVLGEMITVPIDVLELSAGVTTLRRARLPGAYGTPHGGQFSAFDVFIGSGDLAGKTLMCMPAYATSTPGQWLLDITPSAW